MVLHRSAGGGAPLLYGVCVWCGRVCVGRGRGRSAWCLGVSYFRGSLYWLPSLDSLLSLHALYPMYSIRVFTLFPYTHIHSALIVYIHFLVRNNLATVLDYLSWSLN